MTKKKTHEEFKKEVWDLVGDEYSILGEYYKTHSKILMKHNVCGKEYEVQPSAFLRGSRCPKCFGNLKKTQKEFETEIYSLFRNEYEILGNYINADTKIEVKHTICGHIYKVRPHSMLKGHGCPKCGGSMKKTTDIVKKEIYDLTKNEYVMLGEYIDSKTKIKLKHMTCGYIFETLPPNFIVGGTRCPKCARNMKKDTEQFKNEVYDLTKDEYSVLGEYINSETPITMKHNKCGYIYDTKPNNFIQGKRCPKCAGNLKKNTQVFKEEVYTLEKTKYSVLGEYINAKTKIKMKHNECGTIYEVTPTNFLTGFRCPNCFGHIKKSSEGFKKEVYELVKDEYSILGDYINSKTKIKIKHNVCGNEYYIKPSHFLNGIRCPRCNISKGENQIDTILNKYAINYIRQYRISECKNIKPLSFDFAIFNKDSNLVLLIEFDGELHYKAIDYFGGIKTLNETIKRDNIKNNYCRDNNIPLLRIPYWEFNNINKIILKRLWKMNLI